ncbi:tRNA (adenosine(37)-N6)-threonylcarbamoyltransferase complex ATPase subunit type 1 TsaE [Bifidobacterium sp. ESL0763]|uniref:tRNA (adenosine(37)-N6)-threonylcarbamoyltransferase complex ATPase subunit type 1 TsaE n=1 Tax=Bifidobacterium sp. ESL0763 TaxID=2983227 RepID=UPI0023F97FF7|nr:tRNA (adenosine(37)-N6)-threonylcarbamoyltransferase complex ATPase subunit type 1 TsaE [Bifidobacterium sp. ESL0763]MDF7663763.1 tRNA (adenosine(37)-N6)-threonylcarbamoyltransferase complex ATPase subunit type 1 TsaE [Bifidobacterium sp. ESL0763]
MANNNLSLPVPTGEDMKTLGSQVAGLVRGGDVLLLSGPLGAGKTTFAQGFGTGLGIEGPIVSPTFTIARELDGHFRDGLPAHLIHVDAYRLGGDDYAPGQDTVGRLLDELESLGLDEELEDPGEHSVVLMEWGEQMASALAPQRLEVHIDRALDTSASDSVDVGHGDDENNNDDGPAMLSADGTRRVTFVPCGGRWSGFASQLESIRG